MDLLPFSSERHLRGFFQRQVEQYLKDNNLTDLDRDDIRNLLIELHNGVVPSDSTVSLFFSSGNVRVGVDSIVKVLLSKVPFPDVIIKANDIFPSEQTRVPFFQEPDMSSVQYNDNDFISFKEGFIKRGQKNFFGFTYSNRFADLNNTVLTIFEKENTDKVLLEIYLKDIVSVEALADEKGVYPFIIRENGRETVLAADDNVSRDDWIKRISSLMVLQMVSSRNAIDEATFKSLCEHGANINACYGKDDPTPVLCYVLKKRNLDLASYLLRKGARPNCILRWQFMVRDKVMTPAEVLNFFENNGLSPVLKSDDGLNFTIFHYLCYFGNVEEIERLLRGPDAQSLSNDPTESNDIALTIALLSPKTSVETKTLIASRLYPQSNVSICNRSSQSPLQLTLLLGKIDLLFRMLPFATNTRFDAFHNTILHLAIKAHLPSVARFILGYVNFNEWNSLDKEGDSVFTLAMKAGDEELACELLKCGCDPDVSTVNWKQRGCEHDLSLHQALKRSMPVLANEIFKRGGYELKADSEGNYPIHLALLHHLDDCINFLLADATVMSFISQPNRQDQNSPLHLAIDLGFFDHAKNILEAGADVNAVNRFGFTPIHMLIRAAAGETSQPMSPDSVTQLLQSILQRSPNLHIQCKTDGDRPGESAFHMAIREGSKTEHLAMMLLNADPSLVNVRDSESSTPLLRAVEQHSLKLVEALCESQAELDVVNKHRDTPLHIAVRNSDVSIVEYLVNQGAYLRIWNQDGLYPMHIAIQMDNLELLSLLCSFDVDANLSTRDGDTPFILACSVGGLRSANYLLDHRADPYLFNRSEKCCVSVLAAFLQTDEITAMHAELARLVSSCTPVLTHDCFPNVEQIHKDSQVLEDYVNQAVTKGIISPTSSFNSLPRTSTISRDASLAYGTMNTRKKSKVPPPPPKSEPPVETLRTNPNHTLLKGQQQSLLQEIRQLQQQLDTLTERMELEINEKESATIATFGAWKNSEGGKEKINKLKDSIVSRGFDEQIAASKAEESIKKTLLIRTRKTIEEKFEQERKVIEGEIREKEAELEMVNQKVNS